jgi:hypothetical protein
MIELSKTEKRIIRKSLAEVRKYIGIGRSYNSAGAKCCPIKVIQGSDSIPVLEGSPYLKTNFYGKNGFSKTLYTPSTLEVNVGENWIKSELRKEKISKI